MQRLKPFHDNDPHDEINLYALDWDAAGTDAIGANPEFNVENSGIFDMGVFVYITEADLDKEPLSFAVNPYLGKNYASKGIHVQYPEVPLKVKAVTEDVEVKVLGITLRQTLTHDENGEKLLYYPVKKDELQAVLPGEAVPVATAGWFTFIGDAFDDGNEPTPGDKVYLKPSAGDATPALMTTETDDGGGNDYTYVGYCLAAGAGTATGKEEVYIIKLDL